MLPCLKEGQVKLYLAQFRDIQRANEWDCEEFQFFLKEMLVEEACDYSCPANIDGTMITLRVRFGLSPREARAHYWLDCAVSTEQAYKRMAQRLPD